MQYVIDFSLNMAFLADLGKTNETNDVMTEITWLSNVSEKAFGMRIVGY